MRIGDIEVEDQGTIVVFTPLTVEAREYLDELVESEPWQWLGPSLCVDHRMAQGLVDKLQEDASS